MNGSVHYIVITNASAHPTVYGTSESELGRLYKELFVNGASYHGGLEVLDVKRCIVCNSGKTVYNQATLTFDKVGLEIRDMYGNVLDTYLVPEPEKKRFKVVRRETWQNEIEIKAGSRDEAIDIANNLVAEGGFDVLDGYCVDVVHEVYDVLTKGE